MNTTDLLFIRRSLSISKWLEHTNKSDSYTKELLNYYSL